MALPLPDFLALYAKGREKEQESRIFLQWAIQLPLMATADKYTPYQEYYDRLTGANIDTRPAEVIMAEIEQAAARAAQKKHEETETNGA